MLDPKQYDFKNGHSTETALLSVTEALTVTKASAQSSVLILLDLSAAFDTVNHGIFLSTLSELGILVKALSWFESYLSGCSFSVSWQGQSVKISSRLHWCIQGLVLGPLLFPIYTISLGEICSHWLSFHCYVVDTQLFVLLPRMIPQYPIELPHASVLFQFG